eukprot:1612177-Amphidinium_carterae.1
MPPPDPRPYNPKSRRGCPKTERTFAETACETFWNPERGARTLKRCHGCCSRIECYIFYQL